MRTGMFKTWRWFGQADPVPLNWIRQMGVEGIVTALHHIPNGEIWTVEEIRKTRVLIESSGLQWSVVESLPVTEAIKTASPDRERHIANYKQSLRNLGKEGIPVVVYNFMPVLDWIRTDLHYMLPEGGESMLFDFPTFVAFDVFILRRPGAESDYPAEMVGKARSVFEKMTEKKADNLARNIIVVTQGFIDGVVDASVDDYKKAFLAHIDRYRDIGKQELRNNLAYFLKEVVPVAEEAGVRLAIHPDDPPFPVLGLPRIISTADDLEWLEKTCPSTFNGIAFCAGSFSARRDNDLPEMFSRFADRIHFVHLRNTAFLENGSFYESGHITGWVDMYQLVKNILKEQKHRETSGMSGFRIPMRPDHGIKLFNDFGLGGNPGYPLVGRLKGLAEITGLENGILKSFII